MKEVKEVKGVKDVKKRAVALIFIVTLTTGAVIAGRQSSPACRIFSADEVRTVSGANSGTIRQSCRFDSATTSRICTMSSQLRVGSFNLTFTDKYDSIADFVDEIRVIPPIARIRTQTRTYTGGGTGGQIAYEYDATRRQTRLSSNIGATLLITTYDDWDASGRPQRATVGSAATKITLRYKYDDVARTMTTTGPAGVQIDTYDANGNMIHEVATDPTGKTIFSIKIDKTDKVCK